MQKPLASLTSLHRALDRYTWQEVAVLSKDPGVVVLPIGATEQHGPHLPLCTDAILAQRMVQLAFERLAPQTPAWYLPTLPYGKSNEHSGFAGTLTLSAATLTAVISDLAHSLHTSGFKRLLLFNTHGGNLPVLQMLARDLRAQLGMLVFVAMPEMARALSEMPPAEQRLGIHAGTLETAWMLALEPNLVHPQRAQAHYPQVPLEGVYLTSLPQVAWLTRDWSPEGHFGDPTAASPANGERWLEYSATHLAGLITQLCSFEVAHP